MQTKTFWFMVNICVLSSCFHCYFVDLIVSMALPSFCVNDYNFTLCPFVDRPATPSATYEHCRYRCECTVAAPCNLMVSNIIMRSQSLTNYMYVVQEVSWQPVSDT